MEAPKNCKHKWRLAAYYGLVAEYKCSECGKKVRIKKVI